MAVVPEVLAEQQLTEFGAPEARGTRRRSRECGGVTRFVLVRLMWAVVTLVALSLVVFFATNILPGDAARAVLGQNATPERLKFVRGELGLDRPLWEQYFDWIGGTVTGDLGVSLANQMPVSSLLADRVAYSLTLIAATTLMSVPIAVFLGIRGAMRVGGVADRSINASVLILAAIPEFVVGVVLIVVFATGLTQVLPAVSFIDESRSIIGQWKSFVLPAASLALVSIPYITRMTRAAMVDALNSEYARYATVNGVSRRRVAYRHCLPNALPGIVQAIALTLGYIAGSSVVVEAVFNFPGIGSALVQAVNSRDFPVVQPLALAIGLFFVVVLLVADLISALSVPRIRTRL